MFAVKPVLYSSEYDGAALKSVLSLQIIGRSTFMLTVFHRIFQCNEMNPSTFMAANENRKEIYG